MRNLDEHAPEQPLTPEALAQEEEERCAQWMKDHPEIEAPKIDLRNEERSVEIAMLEWLCRSFESTYSLVELHAIVDLKPEDAKNYPARERAKEALIPILEKLKALGRETNISPEKYEDLKEKYMRCSRAVGIISNNKVDHNRKLGPGVFR